MDQLLLSEIYRPHKVRDCILPDHVKEKAQSIVDSGNMTHQLFSGGAGTGKTTLGKAIADELECEHIIYNGSDGSLNIEELRVDVADFAQTVNIDGSNKFKIIIIDEADGLSRAMQGALREPMEKYSKNCRFILTCNYPEKLINAIHSRCSRIDFKFTPDERNVLIRQFANRVVKIMEQEQIEYTIGGVGLVCKEYFPDNRRILNEIQAYTNRTGKLDDGIVDGLVDNVDKLFDCISKNDYSGVSTWVANNTISSIFDVLFRNMENRIPPSNIMAFVMVMNEGQARHGTVPNQTLNALGTIATYMKLVGG